MCVHLIFKLYSSNNAVVLINNNVLNLRRMYSSTECAAEKRTFKVFE